MIKSNNPHLAGGEQQKKDGSSGLNQKTPAMWMFLRGFRGGLISLNRTRSGDLQNYGPPTWKRIQVSQCWIIRRYLHTEWDAHPCTL